MIGGAWELGRWLLAQPESDKVYEVKEKKRRRTLTQNAYYWSMLSELAISLRLGTQEVHSRLIRDYAPIVGTVYLRADINPNECFDYWEVKRYVLINGEKYAEINIFKRSSQMDSIEFGVLIDGLRQECEQQGIPFMTPSEIASLRYGGDAA